MTQPQVNLEEASKMLDNWHQNSPILLNPNRFQRELDPYFSIMLSNIQQTLSDLKYPGTVFASGYLTLPLEIREAYNLINGKVRNSVLDLIFPYYERKPAHKITTLLGIAQKTVAKDFINCVENFVQIGDDTSSVHLVPAIYDNNQILTPFEFLNLRERENSPCVQVYIGTK